MEKPKYAYALYWKGEKMYESSNIDDISKMFGIFFIQGGETIIRDENFGQIIKRGNLNINNLKQI